METACGMQCSLLVKPSCSHLQRKSYDCNGTIRSCGNSGGLLLGKGKRIGVRSSLRVGDFSRRPLASTSSERCNVCWVAGLPPSIFHLMAGNYGDGGSVGFGH